MVLVLTSLCLITIIGLSIAAEAPKEDVLKSYKGNVSPENTIRLRMVDLYGLTGLNFAEAVKFKAPRSDWTLKSIELIGYDGFNGTQASLPSPQTIALEIRDKDLNLLYKYSDSQLPYTNFFRNDTGPVPMMFELPPIKVSDDFYVMIYDRGAFQVMAEMNVTGDSFYFNPFTKLVRPMEVIREKDNKTIPVNWIMVAVGN